MLQGWDLLSICTISFPANHLKCGGLRGKLGVEMAAVCKMRETSDQGLVGVSALSAQPWQYAKINIKMPAVIFYHIYCHLPKVSVVSLFFLVGNG